MTLRLSALGRQGYGAPRKPRREGGAAAAHIELLDDGRGGHGTETAPDVNANCVKEGCPIIGTRIAPGVYLLSGFGETATELVPLDLLDASTSAMATCWRYSKDRPVKNALGSRVVYSFGWIIEWCGDGVNVTRVTTTICHDSPNGPFFTERPCTAQVTAAGFSSAKLAMDWHLACCFSSVFKMSYTPDLRLTLHPNGWVEGTVRGW